MGNLGEDLKAAREKKGLTIKQIAEKTRISSSFLKALEEDDYTSIPGEVFVTGFLKTYARELELNENEILDRYRELRLPPVETQEPKSKPQHKPRLALLKIPHGLPVKNISLSAVVIGGFLVGVLITGVLLLATPKKGEDTHPAAVAAPKPFSNSSSVSGAAAFKHATSSADKSGAAEAAPETPETTVTPGKPVTQAPPLAAAPQAKGQPLSLKLTAKEKSWFSAKIDDGKRKGGILDKGDSITITADNNIKLDLGNAGGTVVEFNGKTMGPYGDRGAVAKNILFSREGAVRR